MISFIFILMIIVIIGVIFFIRMIDSNTELDMFYISKSLQYYEDHYKQLYEINNKIPIKPPAPTGCIEITGRPFKTKQINKIISDNYNNKIVAYRNYLKLFK